jgi:hypothetical protein
MTWLFGQVFVLCLVSFVAGSAVTAGLFVMQRRLAPPPAVDAGEPTGDRRIVQMGEDEE